MIQRFLWVVLYGIFTVVSATSEDRMGMLLILTQQLFGSDNIDPQAWQSVLEPILCANAALHVNLVGNWAPRETFIEYEMAAEYALNQRFRYLTRQLLNETIDWINNDVVEYAVSSQAELTILGIPKSVSFLSQYRVQFDNNCILSVNERFHDPFNALAVLQTSPGANQMCKTLHTNCVGHQPYSDRSECERRWSEYPAKCADPTIALSGNTKGCRTLHSFLTTINPAVHCKHTSLGSGGKCTDQCPSNYFCQDEDCIRRGYCQIDNVTNEIQGCEWETRASFVKSLLQQFGSAATKLLPTFPPVPIRKIPFVRTNAAVLIQWDLSNNTAFKSALYSHGYYPIEWSLSQGTNKVVGLGLSINQYDGDELHVDLFTLVKSSPSDTDVVQFIWYHEDSTTGSSLIYQRKIGVRFINFPPTDVRMDSIVSFGDHELRFKPSLDEATRVPLSTLEHASIGTTQRYPQSRIGWDAKVRSPSMLVFNGWKINGTSLSLNINNAETIKSMQRFVPLDYTQLFLQTPFNAVWTDTIPPYSASVSIIL